MQRGGTRSEGAWRARKSTTVQIKCSGDCNGMERKMDAKNIKEAELSGLDELTLRQRKVCSPEVSSLVTDYSDRNKDLRGGAGFHRVGGEGVEPQKFLSWGPQ